jgi:hypothetical protein
VGKRDGNEQKAKVKEEVENSMRVATFFPLPFAHCRRLQLLFF